MRRMASDELMRRFAVGDSDAIDDVRALALGVIGHKGYYVPFDEREDLVGEVVAGLFEAFEKRDFEVTGDFRGLVRTISHRRCVDWMRAHRRTDELDELLCDDVPSAEEVVSKQEQEELVERVVSRLNETCRELIDLRTRRGLSYKEIGQIMTRSPKALRVDMVRCIGKARDFLWEAQRPGRKTP